jgi:hypothetical protein
MSTISPGPAANAGTAANLHEVRVTDAIESGKEKSAIDTANASAAMAARLFEVRCAEVGGIQH